MLCQECTKRDLCAVLCPEAELYVRQDHVGRDELPVGLPRPRKWPEFVEHTHLTKREKQIVTLLGQGLERVEICEILEITRENCRKIIQRLREKCHEIPV